MEPRPARARLQPTDDATLLVLEMPKTPGVDAVSWPAGGTSELQVTAGGAPVPVAIERFEARMDGGRVVVELVGDGLTEVALAGWLEARNRDGGVVYRWPLPPAAQVR